MVNGRQLAAEIALSTGFTLYDESAMPYSILGSLVGCLYSSFLATYEKAPFISDWCLVVTLIITRGLATLVPTRVILNTYSISLYR